MNGIVHPWILDVPRRFMGVRLFDFEVDPLNPEGEEEIHPLDPLLSRRIGSGGRGTTARHPKGDPIPPAA